MDAFIFSHFQAFFHYLLKTGDLPPQLKPFSRMTVRSHAYILRNLSNLSRINYFLQALKMVGSTYLIWSMTLVAVIWYSTSAKIDAYCHHGDQVIGFTNFLATKNPRVKNWVVSIGYDNSLTIFDIEEKELY